MKAILSICLIALLNTSAFAYGMKDLEGKYRLTSKSLPIVSILSIDSNGNLILIEEAERFSCKGRSALKANVVTAKIKCKDFFDARTFDFSINLTKVLDLNEFTAPLMFPMIGEVSWNFEKID